jgi:4-hydroxybenzoyl-CoA thioesterase
MFHHRRPIRFDDVDAAQIVFFPRYLDYCHEALDALINTMEGGRPRLFNERRVGFPAVHVEMDCLSPLRYGDVLDIRVTVPKIGATSITLRYDLVRESDQQLCTTVLHVCVVSDVRTFTKIPIPDDVRALFASHHTPA